MCWWSPPEEITASRAQKQSGECLLNKCCHSQISLPSVQVEEHRGVLIQSVPVSHGSSEGWMFII